MSSKTLFSLKPTSYRPETSHAMRKGFGSCMYYISFNSFTQQMRYELQKISFSKNVASISRKIATQDHEYDICKGRIRQVLQ